MTRANEADVDWEAVDETHTGLRRKRLARAAGGEELGCSLYELPPGERAWPYHYHTGNEEALYVLAGEGGVRLPEETLSLEPGDYVALPAGPDHAHGVFNDGDEPLRYLAVSTMRDPDVTVYPDSEKVGVFAGAPPGGEGERTVHGYYRREDDVDYWLDEDDGSSESDPSNRTGESDDPNREN